ncbi:hypothetical protein [Sorangium sp. So ce1153]|uniref:hypothetical protein n=1 Tax=Sorangium sp. So ce1153 TaxID=3133333 RepID=UPI003F636C10
MQGQPDLSASPPGAPRRGRAPARRVSPLRWFGAARGTHQPELHVDHRATRDDVAGALAPSATDVQFYRRLRDSIGLPAAWITNGLDTARFSAAAFEVLAAAE